MTKKLLPALFLFFTCQCLYPQSYNTEAGYLVTQQGDTLHGLLKDWNEVSDKILFKAANEKDFKEYTPAGVAVIQFAGGECYKSLEVPLQENQVQRVFLLRLEEGPLNLYQYGSVFFVGKQPGALTRLEKKDQMVTRTQQRVDRRYVGHLKYLTADCPSLATKVERAGFGPDDLSRLVRAYNQCIDPASRASVPQAAKNRIKLGVRLTAVRSNADYYVQGEDIIEYPFRAQLGYSAALFLNLPYKNKLSFQPEVLITRRRALYDAARNNIARVRADLDVTDVQVPVSVYYAFPTGKLRPFLGAGGFYSYTFSNKSTRRMWSLSTGAELDKTDIVVDKSGVGYRLAAGLSYPLYKRHVLGLEYFYENTMVSQTVVQFRIHFTSHNLSVRVNL